MEKTGLEIGQPVEAGAIKIIPVTQISRNHCQVNGALYFFFGKRPAYIITVSASAKKVFRITGEEVSPETLSSEIPELARALSGFL
jgi:hypothetical protein